MKILMRAVLNVHTGRTWPAAGSWFSFFCKYRIHTAGMYSENILSKLQTKHSMLPVKFE